MLRRRLLQSKSGGDIPDNVVDLGLPSGTLWAKGNLCKNGSNYYIGSKTDWGTYVSWGNINGYNEGEGHNFNTGTQLSTDIPTTDAAHDICLARLGSGYNLPTKEQFQELYDNTDNEWVADYNNTGVAGYKFMKKSNHSVFVFFPASGFYYYTTLEDRGTDGYYWSSSRYSSVYGYGLNFDSSKVQSEYNNYTCGFTVRPVYNIPPEPITSKTLSYTINQTNPTASPTSIIVKNTPSNQASSSTDVIAWIHENTDIVVANTSLSNGKLQCAKTGRTDKTKYPDGTSISSFTSKDVFVKLPEFWWKVEEESEDVYKVAFSKEAKTGWNHWEGNTFIGAYKAYNSSSKVYSRSGVTPTVNVTQANFKTYARARGTGYTIISYESHCMLALLGYGWLGTTNSQSVVGYGSKDYPKTTGKCNSLGITDTTTSNGGSSTSNSTSTSINFWGIENWWGDIYEWVDNIETANSSRLVNINDLSGTTVRTVQSPITTSGCIGKMMLGEYGDMIPKEIHSNSSYNNGFCDYGRVGASSGYVAFRSCNGASANGGLGCLYLNSSSGSSGSSIGSRLQYKGDYTMVDKL